MLYNNPYAMGTMSPGTLGIMKGMGLGGQQGPINPMQQAGAGELLPQQKQEKAQYPDVGQMAGMAGGIKGIAEANKGTGQGMIDGANQGLFQGPMQGGGSLTDAMQQRGQYMIDNPMTGGLRNKFGFW